MRLEDFIKRADELIELARSVLHTKKHDELGDFVDEGQFHRLRSSSLAFLLNIFTEDSPYYKEFDNRVQGTGKDYVERAMGILQAARDEIAGGWLQTTKGLVSVEIFLDFIEMAEYLLNEGYKDPSAVIIGSVLEEHLRQLCQKNKIDFEIIKTNGEKISKKADAMNSDLVKGGIYGKLDQKNVTAWLDLRNKAAHGNYGEYTKEQVALMVQGITDFLVRVPV